MPLLIMVLACLIVMVGWIACAGLVATFAFRRVARFRAESQIGRASCRERV